MLIFIVNQGFSQFTIDFEDLEVPEIGYFNGSLEHSGIEDATEMFEYYSGHGIFRVYYTHTEFYDYWSGTAYSNQNDLETADWTNFSAYANYPHGGGYDNSDIYLFGYMWNWDYVEPYSDTINFAIPIKGVTTIGGMYIANSVWAYHYMNGTDGDGAGKYEEGDYFKLIFKGLDYGGISTGDELEFYLADFTNGNSYIIDDWTWVDFSDWGPVDGFEIVYEASDNFTPSYYCIDNIEIINISDISTNFISDFTIYPNPAKDFINISSTQNSEIIIRDISGKIVTNFYTIENNTKINVNNYISGVYIVEIKNQKGIFTDKFIKM